MIWTQITSLDLGRPHKKTPLSLKSQLNVFPNVLQQIDDYNCLVIDFTNCEIFLFSHSDASDAVSTNYLVSIFTSLQICSMAR